MGEGGTATSTRGPKSWWHSITRYSVTAGLAALEELSAKLAAPRCRLKTVVAVEKAVGVALDTAGAGGYFTVHVGEADQSAFRQENKGHPGPKTRYIKTKIVRFELSWAVLTDVVSKEAKYDGTFPLVTNDRTMSSADVLVAYKYQPNLERRHAQLKGHQLVAPVYLKDPVRIEGLLCCHFFALLIEALVEREIRTAMKGAGKRSIPLYPELRDCPAPSAQRIFKIFDRVSRHILRDDAGQTLKVFEPELDQLQLQVLSLLGIPATAYTRAVPAPS